MPTYNIETTPQGEYISRYFEVSEAQNSDQAKRQSLTTLNWQRLQADRPNLGFTSNHQWFRTELRNSTNETLELYLEIGEPLLDRIEVHIGKANVAQPTLVLGDHQPFSNRLINSVNFVVPLTLAPNEVQQLFINVETTSPLNFPVRLFTRENYAGELASYASEQTFFIATFSGFAFFAIVLAVAFRQTRYLYYFFILGAATFGEVIRSGLAFKVLWPDAPYFNSHLLSASMAIYHASVAMIFAQLIKANSIYSQLSTYINGYITSLFIAAVISIPLGETIALKLLSVFVIVGGTGMFALSVKLWRDGNTSLGWFVPIWASMMVLAYVMFGIEAGWIQSSKSVDELIRIGFYPVIALITLRLAMIFAKENRNRIYAEQEVKEHQKAAITEKERYLQLQLISKSEEMEARQRIWQAEAENRAKGQFLATMSHEIRTPMNGVLGITELLQNTNLDKQQRKYVELILSSGKSLLNIINDILDLSKINAGRMELDLVDTPIDQLCDEAISLFASTAEQKGIDLDLFIDPATPDVVRCDPVRLRQVIVNLIGNGLKFTTEGSVSLTISYQRLPRDGQGPSLKFEIKDTGIGIPEEKQVQLFEAFAQADKSTTREYGGTGLGLNICKQLVELMGGELGVTSAEGGGSCFWFTTPYFEPRNTDTQIQNLNLSSFKDALILLVTGDTSIAKQFSAYASFYDLNIKIAKLPNEAMGLAGDQPVDCFIFDSGTSCAEYGDDLLALINAFPTAKTVLLSRIMMLPPPELQEKYRIQAVLQRPIAPRTVLQKLIELPIPGSIAEQNSGATHSDKSAHDGSAKKGSKSGRHRKVLVAEDNAVNQLVVNGMLKQLGIDSVTVDNGRKAYEAFTQTPHEYACILMDCEMPEMDGYQATRLIREYERVHHLSAMPIMALTAHVLADAKNQFKEAGMDEHLSKPINIARLKQAIEQYAPHMLAELEPAT